MIYFSVIIHIGSFGNVSAYDPSKLCSDVATTTSASLLPASTRESHHAHWSNSRDIGIEVGVPLSVLIILIAVVIISYVTYWR